MQEVAKHKHLEVLQYIFLVKDGNNVEHIVYFRQTLYFCPGRKGTISNSQFCSLITMQSRFKP